jgi:hypothetical protein
MAPPRTRFTSLRHAVQGLLAGGGSTRTVSVTRVRVEDAPSLVSMIAIEPFASGWEVANERRLKRLAITADLLTIVGSGLVAILADDPACERARAELRRYAMRVRDNARVVGASFQTEATQVASIILYYLNQARRLAAPRSPPRCSTSPTTSVPRSTSSSDPSWI